MHKATEVTISYINLARLGKSDLSSGTQGAAGGCNPKVKEPNQFNRIHIVPPHGVQN